MTSPLQEPSSLNVTSFWAYDKTDVCSTLVFSFHGMSMFVFEYGHIEIDDGIEMTFGEEIQHHSCDLCQPDKNASAIGMSSCIGRRLGHLG